MSYRTASRKERSFVIRSDIKDFFTRIPRPDILNQLTPLIGDSEFSKILDEASTVELANRSELGEKVNYFPDDILGVAQGSSLSPFLGNVFLREFDRIMNSHDVMCLRYVDDFLLLGRREKATKKAFESALQWLKTHGLEVHELGSEKCHFGSIDDGFDFLGCTIHPGLVQPSKAARTGVRTRVQVILETSGGQLENAAGQIQRKATVARALYDVSNVTYAWGSAYKFCNGLDTMRALEAQIDELVLKVHASNPPPNESANTRPAKPDIGSSFLDRDRHTFRRFVTKRALLPNDILQAPYDGIVSCTRYSTAGGELAVSKRHNDVPNPSTARLAPTRSTNLSRISRNN